MNGVSNTPLSQQLRTPKTSNPPPQRAPQANNTPRAPPAAHHTVVQGQLEEISIDELHDTVEEILAADSGTTSANNNTDKPYSTVVTKYLCANTAITHTNTSASDPIVIKTLVDSWASHSIIPATLSS